MKRLFFYLILFLINSGAFAQCPPSGSATDDDEVALNVAKNKSARKPDDTPTILNIADILKEGKVKDAGDYENGAYVKLVGGYLVSAEEQGGESCNCDEASKKIKDGDIHIYIGLTATSKIKNCMVVEITPSWKKLHPNYDLSSLEGKKVKITGYMLYDFKHKGNSINYCKTCINVWRKTCWEVHPVVSIVLDE